MSNKGGAAAISEDARRQANLRVLQRLDASIQDIAEAAAFVGLYEFMQNEQQWDKKQVEGSLFLVQRRHPTTTTTYQLMILNRNSTDNWTLRVTTKMQLQNQAPYLIMRYKDETGKNVIMGIWFHNNDERDKMAERLQDAITKSAITGTTTTPIGNVDAASALLLSPLNLGQYTIPVSQAPPASTTTSAPAPPTKSVNSNSEQQQQHFVLDKKSLQLSLLSLLQDDRFLDLIHAQYLKVAHARANRKPGPGSDHGRDTNEES